MCFLLSLYLNKQILFSEIQISNGAEKIEILLRPPFLPPRPVPPNHAHHRLDRVPLRRLGRRVHHRVRGAGLLFSSSIFVASIPIVLLLSPTYENIANGKYDPSSLLSFAPSREKYNKSGTITRVGFQPALSLRRSVPERPPPTTPGVHQQSSSGDPVTRHLRSRDPGTGPVAV